MIHTIKLHGFLGQKYAKTVKLDADNVFQIMSALVSRFGPGFKEDVRVNSWHVISGPQRPENALDEQDLAHQLKHKTLHLVPAVQGGSGAVRVIVGVVLMVVGAYFGQGWLVQIGASLALGGVVEMLSKPPTAGARQNQDDNASHIYNSAVNVTSQGGAIPRIYGRVQRCSSVVIATDFSSDEA
ncbi:hypothetical protein [Aquabacterium sp.]|uniref:hypothetical protein n=1 Tax=Aquabacterium sp. TaxID=1872578 RepID=UPI003D6CA0B7